MLRSSKTRGLIAALAAALGFCRIGFAAPATQPTQTAPPLVKCQLTLQPAVVDPREKATHAIRGANMFIAQLELTDQKPAGIRKEPLYAGRPEYGAFRVGNGPKNLTYFVVDEAKGFAGKIYVDQNQNGDLTDDGPADWDESHTPSYGRYCMKAVSVHASWGTPMQEKEGGSYGLLVTKPDGVAKGAYIVTTGRVGMLALGDKTYPVVLAEGSGDGLFTVPAEADLTRAPVSLYIDTENGTPFETWAGQSDGQPPRGPQKFILGQPFQLDGRWYLVRPSISGATLTAQETTAPTQAKAAPAVEVDPMPVGAQAPDFALRTPDGKPVRLSDYKGKLVILDFWATWCGPCQASMPVLEKIYQGIKGQDVVVLSACVLDEKEPFDAWIGKHANTDYHFDFAFDLAGKDDNSIAKSVYKVDAIPSWFLVTRDGKIAAKETGFDGTDGKLIRALKEQKVIFKPE